MESREHGVFRAALRGMFTLLALAALTWGELRISLLTGGSIPILLLFSIAKAALILYLFMHISRLWRTH